MVSVNWFNTHDRLRILLILICLIFDPDLVYKLGCKQLTRRCNDCQNTATFWINNLVNLNNRRRKVFFAHRYAIEKTSNRNWKTTCNGLEKKQRTKNSRLTAKRMTASRDARGFASRPNDGHQTQIYETWDTQKWWEWMTQIITHRINGYLTYQHKHIPSSFFERLWFF